MGTGGGFEFQGVGENSSAENAGDFGGGADAVFKIKVGDDGGGAANGIVFEGDGAFGLEVAKTVVVDNFEDLGLFDTVDGLGFFVVVQEDDLLVPGGDEMVA